MEAGVIVRYFFKISLRNFLPGLVRIEVGGEKISRQIKNGEKMNMYVSALPFYYTFIFLVVLI